MCAVCGFRVVDSRPCDLEVFGVLPAIEQTIGRGLVTTVMGYSMVGIDHE